MGTDDSIDNMAIDDEALENVAGGKRVAGSLPINRPQKPKLNSTLYSGQGTHAGTLIYTEAEGTKTAESPQSIEGLLGTETKLC